MKIHNTEALMSAEISRRSLMKTSALGSLALASSAFTLPFSQMELLHRYLRAPLSVTFACER